jgi:hypothetical protein
MSIKVPLETILTVALLTPMGDPRLPDTLWGLATILWGSPGIGKSARIKAAGKRAHLDVEVVYAATRQPEDVSGAAFPDGQGGVNIKALLPGIQRLMRLKRGCLFLDELSCARPAVQAAFLGVVLERRSGDDILPPQVRVIAAANPPEEAAGGWELEPPMANRLCHIDVKRPTVDEYIAYLSGEGNLKEEDIEVGEHLVQERWGEVWPIVTGLQIGFMRARGAELLHKMPPEGSKERSRGWPSPRSWDAAFLAMATIRCLFPYPSGTPRSDEQKKEFARQTSLTDALISTFMSGCVGEGATTEFLAWAKTADIPTPMQVLRGEFTPNQSRMDIALAAYNATKLYIFDRPTQEDKVTLAPLMWKQMHKLIVSPMADISLPFIREMIDKDLGSKARNQEISEAMQPVMLEAIKKGWDKYLRESK